MDNSELLILLDSEPQLKAKARCLAELGFASCRAGQVDEAMRVLESAKPLNCKKRPCNVRAREH